MISIHTRMMYPEPETTGSGDVPTEAVDNPEVQTPPEENKEPENPYAAALASETIEDTDAGNPEEMQQEEDFTAFDELELDDAERELLMQATKNSGASAAQAAVLMKDIRNGIEARNAEQRKADDAALRDEWGSEYAARMSRAGALINRIAKFAEWTPEQVATLHNAKAFRLFDTLERYVNGGRTVQPTKTPEVFKDKETLKKEAAKIASEFWNARSRGDMNLGEKLMKEHHALHKQIYGKGAEQVLRW